LYLKPKSKKVKFVEREDYIRHPIDRHGAMTKMDNNDRSNLLRTKKGKYYYLRKQRAFTIGNKYYACVNVVNWKDYLWEKR